MIGYRSFDTKSDTKPRDIVFSQQDMEELDASQYGWFRKVVMAAIRPEMFACMYSLFGRPSVPVDILIGIMILACHFGISEDSILEHLKGSIPLQYALCMDKYSCMVPCKRTLIRFRLRLIGYRILTGRDLFHEQAVIIAQKMAGDLDISGDYYRMDSTMINIFAKVLGRVQMLYHVIQGVVLGIALVSKQELNADERKNHLGIGEAQDHGKGGDAQERQHRLAREKAIQAGLPERLWHYLYMDDYNSRFYARRSKSTNTEEILEDAAFLWRHYHLSLADGKEFQMFTRVLLEQCEWVTSFERDREKDASVSYAGKRILRFKLSNKELEEIRRSEREFRKLQKTESDLRKKYENVKARFSAATKKALKASERAEKAKAKGSPSYERLEKKAGDLKAKAESLSQQCVELETLYSQALEAYSAELEKREMARSYIVVEESMEGDVRKMDSDILQSPNDTTATYTDKNGVSFRGYKCCVIEKADGHGHSMPVEWRTTPNNVSDQVVGAVLIREAKPLFSGKREPFVVADGAFAGNEIDAAAKEAGVEVVNTEMKGQKTADHLADFEFDRVSGKITACAEGQDAKDSSVAKDGMSSAVFDASECAKCSHFKQCKPTIKGEKATVKASLKQKVRALFQRAKGAEAHAAFGRFRNGSEATMNQVKQKSPVSRQPIYGYFRVSLFNDVAMCAVCFSKTLAQHGVRHDRPNLAVDYSEVFPEDSAVVQSEEVAVQKDLDRAMKENNAAQGESQEGIHGDAPKPDADFLKENLESPAEPCCPSALGENGVYALAIIRDFFGDLQKVVDSEMQKGLTVNTGTENTPDVEMSGETIDCDGSPTPGFNLDEGESCPTVAANEDTASSQEQMNPEAPGRMDPAVVGADPLTGDKGERTFPGSYEQEEAAYESTIEEGTLGKGTPAPIEGLGNSLTGTEDGRIWTYTTHRMPDLLLETTWDDGRELLPWIVPDDVGFCKQQACMATAWPCKRFDGWNRFAAADANQREVNGVGEEALH